MRRLAAIFVFLAGLIAANGMTAAAGIDEAYLKDNGRSVWGDLLSEFFRFRQFSKSYALVVGINDYTGGYQPLPTADDPIRMRDFLLNEAGFDYVHVLTNEKATARRVRELMVDVFPEMVGSKDRFLFYWSGHGDQRQNAIGGQIGYLPLADSARSQFSSMISMGDIRRWDELLNAQQVLFLLDACFSGLAGSTAQSDQKELNLEQLMRPSHHLITAGTSGEKTIASDRWGGSIFTDSVLAAARGAADSSTEDDAADGVISLHELINYVQKRVAREKNAAGWSGRITPQLRDLRGSDGQFFFLSNDHKIAVTRDETTPADANWVFKGGVPYVEEPQPPPAPVPVGEDVHFWQGIQDSRNLDDFVFFIENYSDSPLVPLARQRLEGLREAEPVATVEPEPLPAEIPQPAPASEPLPSPDVAERAPSLGQKALETALGLSEDLRKSLQWSLYQQGYYNGPIDGVLGKWSREAIAAWKARLGLEPSSYLITRTEVDRLLDQIIPEQPEQRPSDPPDPKPMPREEPAAKTLSLDQAAKQRLADALLARWAPRRYRLRDTGWQDCTRRIGLGPLRPSGRAKLARLADVEPGALVEVQKFDGFDVDAEVMAVVEAERATVIEHKLLKNVRGWCSREIFYTAHFSQLLRSSGLAVGRGIESSIDDAEGFVYTVAGKPSDGEDQRCLLFVAIEGKRRIDGFSCPRSDDALTASAIARFLERIRI
ncbi:MAG: caspase family protein [Pseudomonadota bacterium]